MYMCSCSLIMTRKVNKVPNADKLLYTYTRKYMYTCTHVHVHVHMYMYM